MTDAPPPVERHEQEEPRDHLRDMIASVFYGLEEAVITACMQALEERGCLPGLEQPPQIDLLFQALVATRKEMADALLDLARDMARKLPGPDLDMPVSTLFEPGGILSRETRTTVNALKNAFMSYNINSLSDVLRVPPLTFARRTRFGDAALAVLSGIMRDYTGFESSPDRKEWIKPQDMLDIPEDLALPEHARTICDLLSPDRNPSIGQARLTRIKNTLKLMNITRTAELLKISPSNLEIAKNGIGPGSMRILEQALASIGYHPAPDRSCWVRASDPE